MEENLTESCLSPTSQESNSAMSLVSPRVEKSLAYLEKKRAQETVHTKENMQTLKKNTKSSLNCRQSAHRSRLDDTLTAITEEKTLRKENIASTRTERTDELTSQFAGIQAQIDNERAAAKLLDEKNWKKLQRYQEQVPTDEGTSRSNHSAMTNMEQTVSRIVQQSDCKAEKKLKELQQIVEKRCHDFAQWKSAIYEHQNVLAERRKEKARATLQEKKEELREQEFREKVETDFNTATRVLFRREGQQRKKLLEEECYEGNVLLARCQIMYRKATEEDHAAAITEALRIEVQMKKFAAEQKQLAVVEEMLKRERDVSKAFEARKSERRAQEAAEKAAAIAASEDLRQKARENNAQRKLQNEEEEKVMGELHRQRREELHASCDSRKDFHKMQCRLGAHELNEHQNIAASHREEAKKEKEKLFRENIKAVREQHILLKRQKEEQEEQVRELKLSRYRERFEESRGKESSFAEIVRRKEERARLSHLALMADIKEKKRQHQQRMTVQKQIKALEMKEDSLFAREVAEVNRVRDHDARSEKVRHEREKSLAERKPIYTNPPVSTIINKTPTKFTEPEAIMASSLDTSLTHHLSMTQAKPLSIPRREPCTKSFAYPTPAMMEDPNINPAIKETAERMLELMKELHPKTTKMALSPFRVSEVSAHLLRSNIEKSVLQDELAEKNTVRTIHDSTPPVKTVNKRLYDKTKMTGHHLPAPDLEPEGGHSFHHDDDFSKKFYESQISQEKKTHAMLAKKYDFVPPEKRYCTPNWEQRLGPDDFQRREKRNEASLEKLLHEKDSEKVTLTPAQIHSANQKFYLIPLEKRAALERDLINQYIVEHVAPKKSKAEIEESLKRLAVVKHHE